MSALYSETVVTNFCAERNALSVFALSVVGGGYHIIVITKTPFSSPVTIIVIRVVNFLEI